MKISSLIIVSAMAAATTAESAHAEILTMTCEGYNVVFSQGSLTSHAPKKDRDYPITKVDVQNDRTIVSGITKYGKITAFFSNDGNSSIVWTNGKDVVLNQCVSETAAMAAPRTLQESRSEADEAAARAEAAAQRAERAAANAATQQPQNSWDAEVDRVTALSSRQNHGTPLYLHFCEPKFKECSDVIAYKNSDGLRVSLQVHRDIHGATINRLVCKLNEKEDIRVCADFDTGAETTAMQDMDGNWQDITDSESPPKKELKGAVHF
jgi:hypothetical protein